MSVFEHHVADVLTAAPPVPLASTPLGTYTLLPHHRAGAAAGYRTPFSTAAPARAVIEVRVPLADGTGGTDAAVGQVGLRGPGDVLGLDPRQVVRRYPTPGTRDAEPSDLVHCELDQPDLPWMFTPCAPDGAGHLAPWLRLVVVADTGGVVRPPSRPGLPSWAEVPAAELPPPEEAWAWAHAQVIGPVATAAGRLGPENPALNVARLLCPRHLEPNRRWVALVVPTFEVGRRAGLGDDREPRVTDLRWAWGSTPDAVPLPVYDHWTFSTGDDADFEALARRIRPVAPPPGTGRRLVDTTNPGLGITVTAEDGPRPVHGALVRPVPAGEPDTAAAVPPPGTAGTWDATSTTALVERVEHPDRVRFDPDETDPEVAPPLYAGTHLATGTVPADGAEPAWLRQLNLDPAHRVAASLGAAVARMDQEDLMASAWAQLPSVLEANAALRAAQLARFAGDRLHARHLARLDPGALLAVTARSHARTVPTPGTTTRGAVGASATPTAATSTTLRRLARPAGPLRRFTDDEDVRGSGALLADGDVGHDWVHRYRAPDGARGIGEDASDLLRENGIDPVRVGSLLGERSALDALAAGEPQPVDPSLVARLGRGRLLEQLLDALPTPVEIETPEADAEAGHEDLLRVGHVLVSLMALLQTHGEWLLSRRVVERHRLDGHEVHEAPGRLLVPGDVVRDNVVGPLSDLLRNAQIEVPREPDPASSGLAAALVEAFAAQADALAEAQERVAEEAYIGTDDLREAARERLTVGVLRLPELLLPRRTLGRRLRERVPGLELHFPGWLDNDRFDPVMAAPRFTHPMYEALHRLDPEWLLPGVAAISPHEMMTALETNPVFVEAFLLGLNHEFARELVWRGYPTDGRGTSFRSFWTARDELTQPVHRLRTGALGTHLDRTATGTLVILLRGELVRRYPHLLGHAVRQKGDTAPIAYAAEPARTLFQMRIGADLLLTGVDLSADTALADDAPGADGRLAPVPPDGAWWFTVSEHVGEPRFGLDVAEGALPAWTGKRDDLHWGHWPMTGSHLSAAGAPTVTGEAPPRTAADVAWQLFQQPARAGYRLGRMLRPSSDQEPSWP
ncbi:hypothetical protein ACK8HX_02390 [Oryzobacter sp. R7]|uniref:hypothetical protein n=1 Tax=Oryzobacter faecalis TaxID=3388656 RepID=UPI00398CECA3